MGLGLISNWHEIWYAWQVWDRESILKALGQNIDAMNITVYCNITKFYIMCNLDSAHRSMREIYILQCGYESSKKGIDVTIINYTNIHATTMIIYDEAHWSVTWNWGQQSPSRDDLMGR